MPSTIETVINTLSSNRTLVLTGFTVGMLSSMTFGDCMEEPLSNIFAGSLFGGLYSFATLVVAGFLPDRLRAGLPVVLVMSLVYCKCRRKTTKINARVR